MASKTATSIIPTFGEVTLAVYREMGQGNWLDPFRRICQAIQPEQATSVLKEFYWLASRGKQLPKMPFKRGSLSLLKGTYQDADWDKLYQQGLQLEPMRIIGYTKAIPGDQVGVVHRHEQLEWMEANRIQTEMPLVYVPSPDSMFVWTSREDVFEQSKIYSLTDSEAIAKLQTLPRSMASFIVRDDLWALSADHKLAVPYDGDGDIRNYQVVHTAGGRVIAQGHSYSHNKNNQSRQTQFSRYLREIVKKLDDPILVTEHLYASRPAFDQYMRQMSKINRVTQFGMGYGDATWTDSKWYTDSVDYGVKSILEAEANGKFFTRLK